MNKQGYQGHIRSVYVLEIVYRSTDLSVHRCMCGLKQQFDPKIESTKQT